MIDPVMVLRVMTPPGLRVERLTRQSNTSVARREVASCRGAARHNKGMFVQIPYRACDLGPVHGREQGSITEDTWRLCPAPPRLSFFPWLFVHDGVLHFGQSQARHPFKSALRPPPYREHHLWVGELVEGRHGVEGGSGSGGGAQTHGAGAGGHLDCHGTGARYSGCLDTPPFRALVYNAMQIRVARLGPRDERFGGRGPCIRTDLGHVAPWRQARGVGVQVQQPAAPKCAERG